MPLDHIERHTRDRVILAADTLTLEQCHILGVVGPSIYAIKIHNLWDQYGPGVVGQLRAAGYQRVFVDLKLHDIPETVKLRAKAVKEAGADMLTVHAAGGIDMMRMAAEHGPAEVLGITVLTSLDSTEAALYFGRSLEAQVLLLAQQIKLAGLSGIVCSPREVLHLSRRRDLNGLTFNTPGIRSAGQNADDQKRVDTPVNALQNGATRIIMGRQLTNAPDPREAIAQLAEELVNAPA